MHDKKLYGTATVGTKGQIVIPADAREELGIKTGDRLYVVGSPKACAVTFIQEEQLEGFIERLNLNLEGFRQQRQVIDKKEKKEKE
jgi:AbrB family looped-hinge helix DNA binding protein